MPEFELADTGVFNENRYFDVLVEYAKQSTDDIFIRITVANRGPEAATLHLLPTLWFRNTWSWGCKHEGCWPKPRLRQSGDGLVTADHVTLDRISLVGVARRRWQITDAVVHRERNQSFPSFRLRHRCAVHERFVRRLRHPRPHTMR